MLEELIKEKKNLSLLAFVHIGRTMMNLVEFFPWEELPQCPLNKQITMRTKSKCEMSNLLVAPRRSHPPPWHRRKMTRAASTPRSERVSFMTTLLCESHLVNCQFCHHWFTEVESLCSNNGKGNVNLVKLQSLDETAHQVKNRWSGNMMFDHPPDSSPIIIIISGM